MVGAHPVLICLLAQVWPDPLACQGVQVCLVAQGCLVVLQGCLGALQGCQWGQVCLGGLAWGVALGCLVVLVWEEAQECLEVLIWGDPICLGGLVGA